MQLSCLFGITLLVFLCARRTFAKVIFVFTLFLLFFFFFDFIFFFFFFFSSRRRHTIYIGDWSSDVCSSDLVFTSAALGADGSPLFEVLTTMTFAEQTGKTKQTMRARVIIKTTARAGPYIDRKSVV